MEECPKCQHHVQDRSEWGRVLDRITRCGRPAKYVYSDNFRKDVLVCGIHRKVADRILFRIGLNPCLPYRSKEPSMIESDANMPKTDGTKLWAMHIEGTNDYIPCESQREAAKMCEGFNAGMDFCHGQCADTAKVAEWPRDAESHAKGMSERKAYENAPQTARDEDEEYPCW